MNAQEGGWHPDPLGRWEYRYWNGERWTEHVSWNDRRGIDPPEGGYRPGPANATSKMIKQDRRAQRAASAAAARSAAVGERSNHFEGVSIRNGMISGPGGHGPVGGATATVDMAGAIDARFTATRLALMGPFALAFKKKKDKRELYLAIEGQGFGILQQVPPALGAQARAFAAKINGLSRAAVAAPSVSSATTSSRPLGQRLRELAELRDAGVLTEDEFRVQKARLLG